MQPRTVGAKAKRLIEREAPVPQCVNDVIEPIARDLILPVADDVDSVALLLRAHDSSVTSYFDERVSGNAFPYCSGKRQWIDRDLGSGDCSQCDFWVEVFSSLLQTNAAEEPTAPFRNSSVF